MLFEVCDDIVAFGHPVDVVGLVDEHRYAGLAAYLFDFRTLAVRAGDSTGLVLKTEFVELGGYFSTVRTAGQFVQDEI